MGLMTYGDSRIEIAFDDRSLAHLQAVIGLKLRRNESMFLSWTDDPALGDGRSSIWLSREIPLHFSFDGPADEPLNRAWLEILTRSANSPTGLQLIEEPHTDDVPTPRPVASVIGRPHKQRR
ncbi:MAG: hypothetical protein QOF79_672 [Actinomycetota bacterium]|jgi:hypothetical protein|nr:hypothetical protein [Actinomycetota bacterium]